MSVKLYHGDCLEVLPTIEKGSASAVVTDPPYGIGFNYNSHDDSPDGYGEWLWRCIEMAEATCTNDPPVFVWQTMLNARRFADWFPRDWRIFAACKGFVQYRPIPIQYSWDPVLFWGKPRGEPSVYSKDWYVQRKAPFGKNRPSIQHPCPRPIEQVVYIIEIATRQGDVVLDPFMGSGTTGIACINTGRKFIGIEIDKDYFDIAKSRIETAQPRLL